MSRNNAGNKKTHNERLQKVKEKKNAQKLARAEQLKAIIKKHNESKS